MTFRIVVDTREKEEYSFPCPVIQRKLEAGDYSVQGYEDRVAIERKSLTDFVHTVIHDFERFAAELDKLAGMEAAGIVVEADLDAVLRGQHAETLRAVSAPALLGFAVHIGLRWGVPVFWCGSRQAAVAFTEAFLRTFVRQVSQTGGAVHG